MSQPGAVVIGIDDLAVSRGARTILDGLSLTVRAGEVFALLGGNGSGKSTLLLTLLGLLPRSRGVVRLLDKDPDTQPDAARALVSWLPENVALYEHLTARENLEYFLDLAGTPKDDQQIEAALTTTGLPESAWDRPLSGYSKGMRQKTGIALALLRDTAILLLDEPASGLDPGATAELNRLLQTLKARGVAVLMVTHDLLGAADVADRIGVLREGRLANVIEAADTTERFDLAALHRAFQKPAQEPAQPARPA